MSVSRAVALPRRAVASRALLRRSSWILGELQRRRSLKATDVAAHFEINVRTAYRDFDFLRDDWNVPVEFDRARQSYVLTEPTALVAPVTISRGELLALFFAERAMRQFRGTPFERDFEHALHKLQEMLPESVTVAPDVLGGLISLDLGPVYAADAAVFADVLRALQARRLVLLRYRSLNSGRTTDRRVRPYHVFNHRGDWYLAAWDERRAAVRDFALHRIRRVTTTTERYDVPGDFDARAYLGEAFAIEKGAKGARPVEVAIRFAARQARWIRERRWHPSARVQDAIDSGCVLRMRVAGLGEVKRWVLQFGAEAEVLKPASLRREVVGELERARGVYGKGD
ncbi:MAG TPA: WYL domain-containing protein [Vicinamibacterales bacterium]|nr:WYL domain-containing protein [Vicinamibacterales bacterium]